MTGFIGLRTTKAATDEDTNDLWLRSADVVAVSIVSDCSTVVTLRDGYRFNVVDSANEIVDKLEGACQ